MKFSKSVIAGYILVAVIFTLLGFVIKLPLFAIASEKQSIFQSLSILEIISIFVFVTILYFAIMYFIPVKGIAEQIKSYREPLMKLQKDKFEYWLKSELYEKEIEHRHHVETMEAFEFKKALDKIDVFKKAAELNGMETDNYVKVLTAKANANYIDATSETEKAHAKILLEAVAIMPKMTPMWQAYVISCVTKVQNVLTDDLELKKEINEIVKDKQKEDLRKSVIENDNLEEKYKRNKQPAQ